jgi:hypothetical protein
VWVFRWLISRIGAPFLYVLSSLCWGSYLSIYRVHISSIHSHRTPRSPTSYSYHQKNKNKKQKNPLIRSASALVIVIVYIHTTYPPIFSLVLKRIDYPLFFNPPSLHLNNSNGTGVLCYLLHMYIYLGKTYDACRFIIW